MTQPVELLTTQSGPQRDAERARQDRAPGDLSFAATLGFVQSAEVGASAGTGLTLNERGPEPQREQIRSSVDRRADDRVRGGREQGSGQSAQGRTSEGEPSVDRRVEVRSEPVSRGQGSRDPGHGTKAPTAGEPSAAKSHAPQSGTAAAMPSQAQGEAVAGQGAREVDRAANQPGQAPAVRGAGGATVAAGSPGGKASGGQAIDRLAEQSRRAGVFKLKRAQAPPRQGAEVARQVSRGLAQLLRRDGGTLTLKITPNSLGEVRVEMRASQGRVEAVIEARDEVARGLLESQMSRLRGALEARGVTVDRLEVRSPAEPTGSGTNGGGTADPSGQDARGAPRDGHEESPGGDRRDGARGGDRTRPVDGDAEVGVAELSHGMRHDGHDVGELTVGLDTWV